MPNLYTMPSDDKESAVLCSVYRHRARLTQAKAATRLNISLRAWQYYEAGTRTPPLRVLRKMLNTLNKESAS